MRYLIFAIIFLTSCNPLKHAENIINQSEEAKNRIGEEWVKNHPCVNDTITKIHSDTIQLTNTETKYLPGKTNTVTNTRVDTLYKTVTNTKIVHDTITNTVTDNRAVLAAQAQVSDEKNNAVILQGKIDEANKRAANRLWWLIGLFAFIAAYTGIKIYNGFNPTKKIFNL